VIVTFECREFALACLRSIEEQLPWVLATTVVVDNASRDGTAAAVAAAFTRVRVVEKRHNAGFAAAANTGMRALGDCDVLCLLNPDAELLDSGLMDAAMYLDGHPEIAVAGVRIENADGSLQTSCRAFPGHRTALFNRHSLTTRFAPNNRWSQEYLMTDWPHDQIREVDWVSGACMLIHRRALDQLGYLDPHYFFSIEDVDFCRRAHDAGMGVIYYPMARVRHLVGKSSRHNAYRAMAAHHAGMWRYYRKHMDGNVLLDAVTAAGIVARLGLHAGSYAMRSAVKSIQRA
jgi:GT2 family glycosyltransferase